MNPGDRLRVTDSTQVILNYLPQSFAAAQQPCGLQSNWVSSFLYDVFIDPCTLGKTENWISAQLRKRMKIPYRTGIRGRDFHPLAGLQIVERLLSLQQWQRTAQTCGIHFELNRHRIGIFGRVGMEIGSHGIS